MRTIITALTLLLFTIGISFAAHSIARAQEVQKARVINQEYMFPYAGIGPDSPLYPLKEMRDSLWVFFTRDHNKKAELLLMISDKKVVMAQQLAQKKDWNQSIEMLRDSEEDISRLLRAHDDARKIGYAPSADFVRKAQQSSEAHLFVMKNIFKKIDPVYRKELEGVMKKNVENFNSFSSLK